MNAVVQAQKPSRKLAVFAALWMVISRLGWGTNGAMLLNVICGFLVLGTLAFAMVRETRTLRLRGMTFAAALLLGCWFAVVGFFTLFPFWFELSQVLLHWPLSAGQG